MTTIKAKKSGGNDQLTGELLKDADANAKAIGYGLHVVSKKLDNVSNSIDLLWEILANTLENKYSHSYQERLNLRDALDTQILYKRILGFIVFGLLLFIVVTRWVGNEYY